MYNILSHAAYLDERGFKLLFDVILLFIMQATTAVPLQVTAGNCYFRHVNCQQVLYDNIKRDLEEVGYVCVCV